MCGRNRAVGPAISSCDDLPGRSGFGEQIDLTHLLPASAMTPVSLIRVKASGGGVGIEIVDQSQGIGVS